MACRLATLVCIVLLSAAMANGIRTAGTVGVSAPAPAVTATPSSTAAEIKHTMPPVATSAATVHVHSDQQEEATLDDPNKDSKRKVPNGPDPIHNRRARWGEAPAKRV